MKKIIKGKVYNTETAKMVGEYSNGLSYSDFCHCYEELFQKKTGEFFLWGAGGPMSKYAEHHGWNETSGSEKIMPMTYNEAKEWAEDHLDADEFEAIFGEVSEDESKVQICISISVASAEKAKREAAKAGISVSDYIESLI